MNKHLEEINTSAYQYYTAYHPTFLDICQPLFDLGVKWFCYIKMFEDGSYVVFSTHEEFMKQYFLTIKSQGITPTPEIESSPIGQSHHVLFPSNISLYDKTKDAILYLAYDYNIWHIYSIYKNKSDYVESYGFAMNVADEYAPQFYLKNMPLLEHFCHYFSERAADLVSSEDKQKRGYFQQQFKFHSLSSEDRWAQKAEQFLLKTHLQRLPFKGKNHDVLLSKRETECLRYLASGKSIKEIGRALDLSPRTIEFYINKVKEKTGYVTKTELLTHFIRDIPSFCFEGISYTRNI